MPFTKSVTKDSGVVVTYWIITAIQFDFLSDVGTIWYSGYLDQDHYNQGKGPEIISNIKSDMTEINKSTLIAAAEAKLNILLNPVET